MILVLSVTRGSSHLRRQVEGFTEPSDKNWMMTVVHTTKEEYYRHVKCIEHDSPV